MRTMDGIIDTVSAFHPLLPLIDLLKSHGKLVMVGAPNKYQISKYLLNLEGPPLKATVGVLLKAINFKTS